MHRLCPSKFRDASFYHAAPANNTTKWTVRNISYTVPYMLSIYYTLDIPITLYIMYANPKQNGFYNVRKIQTERLHAS
jgi:hypothetical protein